ncbi:hypothetical protein FWF89_03200 [Candidatus Saccharibacteria bacterium]|nr:hypothetical protein [Candidatus Saccharibacteria bacterium]
MSEVLVVGNVTKDVYLRLDNRLNKFEVDGEGVTWLDLAFDGSSHQFYARHSVFGGAAVTLEVLSRFGITAKIAGNKMGFANGQLTEATDAIPEIYRYILSQDDNITYFGPSQQRAAKWQPPSDGIDWVFIDRSACVSRELAEEILSYLESAPNIKLAFFACKRAQMAAGEVHMCKLKERADLIFTEVKNAADCSEKCICIGRDYIQFGNERVDWSLQERQDMMTHLTTDSIIAASILGATVLGKSAGESLLLARANVENANLDGALNLNRLEEMVVGENYRVGKVEKKEEQND